MKTVATLVISFLIGTLTAHSQIINIDFNSTNNGDGATYVGLGAAPDNPSNNFWNGISNDTFGGIDNLGTGVQLFSSDGANFSPITVNISSEGGGYSGTGNDLLKDYLYINSSTNNQTITISGLDNASLYDIYLYGTGDTNGQGSTFTYGATSLQTSNSPRDAVDFAAGLNYVLFQNLAPTSGDLTFNWVLGPDGNNGALNGLQIITDAVPEPSTNVLFAIGGIGILIIRIRRNRVVI